MDYHRVNFDLRNNGLAVCWGHHEKADGCDYEVLAPQETLKIIEDLRAELEKLKRQWAEDDRDITELEDENNQLRAELAAEREKVSALEIKVNNQQDWLVEWRKCEEALKAERKKREEAEADVYKLGQENIELEADLSATKKKCDEYREMANKVQIGGESFQLQFLAEEEDKCRGLEIQVEVLREALGKYADHSNWGYIDDSGCEKGHGKYTEACFVGPGHAEEILANLPGRAEAIGKVLEAAERHEEKAHKKGNDHERHVVLSGD